MELCSNLYESGTTPSAATIRWAVQMLDIPVFVLVRPRGGDFVYSELEFELLRSDIEFCRNEGVAGIVSGALLPDNSIDRERTRLLLDAAAPLPFTFHRAFDLTPDLNHSLETLIELGVDRVLTSGGKPTAPQAVSNLKNLHEQAAGRITILPGGGINSSNIAALLTTGCAEFHMTGNAFVRSPALPGRIALNGSADIPERDHRESSVERIQAVVEQLRAAE